MVMHAITHTKNAGLTSVQDADMLNVSRPFLIGLLEADSIPHCKVEKHRRMRMEDAAEVGHHLRRKTVARRHPTISWTYRTVAVGYLDIY